MPDPALDDTKKGTVLPPNFFLKNDDDGIAIGEIWKRCYGGEGDPDRKNSGDFGLCSSEGDLGHQERI